MPILLAAAAASIIALAYAASWIEELITTRRLPTRIDENGDY